MTRKSEVVQVVPVIDKSMRVLCKLAYPNHPKGCPNWNKKDTCPPKAPLLESVIILSEPVYLAYNAFDFGGHVKRMKDKHPNWSDRQTECCLYWQGTARKQLRQRVESFLADFPYPQCLEVLYCPEACGVNITATMQSIGITMEWPPKTVAYQVALIGKAIVR